MENTRKVYLTILQLWSAYLTIIECSSIIVDPVSGNDTLCSTPASPNPSLQPCRTLRYALGNVGCDCRYINESNVISVENIVIELADGVHTIEDCVGITYGANITIKAESSGQAIIECGHFPSRERFETGLLSCNTVDLTFRGIVFQHCGPYTPNVFLNRSSNVLFEDCIFR